MRYHRNLAPVKQPKIQYYQVKYSKYNEILILYNVAFFAVIQNINQFFLEGFSSNKIEVSYFRNNSPFKKVASSMMERILEGDICLNLTAHHTRGRRFLNFFSENLSCGDVSEVYSLTDHIYDPEP